MEKYLTRPVKEVIEFKTPGTFESMYSAERWLNDNGYSSGSNCAMMPTAVMKGDYYAYNLPEKWKNFTSTQKDSVHGVMVGDMREGPVFLIFFEI